MENEMDNIYLLMKHLSLSFREISLLNDKENKLMVKHIREELT